jgi:GNAT superfamily N-acetyltransferase
MPAHVRFATIDDARGLAELRWLSRGARERDREPLDQFEETFRIWLGPALASGKWYAAVAALVDGGLVGCMYLHFIEKVPVPGEAHRMWGYITHAYVREAHRGNGIASGLLGALIERARSEGAEFLVVWPSREAVSLYGRAGFLSGERERQVLPGEEPSLILHLHSGEGPGREP